MRLFISWIYILPFLEFKMISIVFSVPSFSHKNNLIIVSLNPWK